MLGTVELLGKQDGIQHVVPRLLHGPDALHAGFQLVQVLLPFLRAGLQTDHPDLMLQIMVFSVDGLNVLSGLPVLLVLPLKQAVDGIQLHPGLHIPPTVLLGDQHNPARQIHQCANIKNLRPRLSAQRRVGIHIADIAD